jgi:hypothetical protein
LFQAFPKFHGKFVERNIAREQIIGTDNRGVAANVAISKPAFFQHRNASDAMVFGQVISRGKTMTTPADNDDIIGRGRCGVPPCGFPSGMST